MEKIYSQTRRAFTDMFNRSFFHNLQKESLGLVTKEESESHHGDPEALEGAVTQEEAEEVSRLYAMRIRDTTLIASLSQTQFWK